MSDDKIDILMNKIAKLEKDLSDERKSHTKTTEELTTLKNVTLPTLTKELDEKDKLYATLMITQITLEKEINILKEAAAASKTIDPSIAKYIIPEFQEDKDKLIIKQTNTIEYLNNLVKELKAKLNNNNIENTKLRKDYEEKYDTQYNEISTLKTTITKKDEKISSLSNELKSLSNINKNLVIEIKSLNTMLDDVTNEKNKYAIMSTYYEKENEILNQNFYSISSRMAKLDTDYQAMNTKCEEYKLKITEMDTKTYMFNVTSIGQIVESAAELVFRKENKKYIVDVKYMTSTSKYDILDIESISQQNETDDVIIIKYKNGNSEAFRTNDVSKIIRVYKEFSKKAIQHMDVKVQQKEDKMKQKQIKKNVKEMLSIFGN